MKKLLPHLKEKLTQFEIEELKPFQKETISGLKGGSDLFLVGEKNSGKTTALILSTIQLLQGEAEADSPRAIILVADKEEALELQEKFKPYIRGTDLRMIAVFEGKDPMNQIDEIYLGMDIVIATITRLSKIYFLNGIHLGELKLLAVEDAKFIMRNNYQVEIIRISESLKKSRYLVTAEKMTPRIEQLRETFMERARTIQV